MDTYKKNGDTFAVTVSDSLKKNFIDLIKDFSDWDGVHHSIFAPTHSSCQPKGLKLTLYDYQAKGLSWFVKINEK